MILTQINLSSPLFPSTSLSPSASVSPSLDHQDHLNMCEYFEVPCPLCKEKIMRKDMPEHLSRKCKYRETTCEFCKHKMALTELQVLFKKKKKAA